MPIATGFCPGHVGIRFSPSVDGAPAPQINGQVVDVSGVGVAGANVNIYDTLTDLVVSETQSNSDGSYAAKVPDRSKTYYANGYLAGSPDRAGTTVNTLTGV